MVYVSNKTPIILFAIAALLGGCVRQKEDESRVKAEILYRDLSHILKMYEDSLAGAQDSAAVIRLYNDVSHKMTDAYFNYSAEAGLKISEAENDTLSSLTERIIHLHDSLLYRFGNPVELPDSLGESAEEPQSRILQ